MRCFEHSEEISNADIDIDVDNEKLNKLEQLGLYLLGDISLGRLAELWGVCSEQVLMCMSDFQNSFENILDKHSIK